MDSRQESQLVVEPRHHAVALALAAAVSFMALALSPAPSQARVAEDYCGPSGDAQLVEYRFGGGYTACQAVYHVPAWQIHEVPPVSDPNLVFCPEGTALGNVPYNTNFFTRRLAMEQGHWNFWALRGEWVTLADQWGPVDVRITPDGLRNHIGIHPRLHNWWIGGAWPVRVYLECTKPPPPSELKPRAARGEASAEPGDPDWPGLVDETANANYDDGSGKPDELEGGAEGELIQAGREDDQIDGAGGDDQAFGEHGDDDLDGGRGDDQLLGGPGDDTATGGTGSDELFDRQGTDLLLAGPGNDRLASRDDDRDQVRCGGGEDVVVADPRDRLEDCEHVYRTRDEAPQFPPEI